MNKFENKMSITLIHYAHKWNTSPKKIENVFCVLNGSCIKRFLVT